ncbi:hypothetical protein BD324DRAFT_609700 [Kockovaella imperatae]|uniref:Uncharacterized protein n=1 Tax=Kockovaella imperatae TaxID=4999 RepID=A0A1Y1UA96_9TREE|nr:hypothetical protein BD324DRAFT_609700 [Kockovaella imperatae]ORX34949.1 hypothetical protein BD324DRAFT_609700 [Kockovaella imperatae]
MSSGLNILLLRPQLLLASLHDLVLLTALRLIDPSHVPIASTLSFDDAAPLEEVETSQIAMDRLAQSLRVNQEVMDKIRGMESKLAYQIKKLSGLAEAEEARGKQVIEDVEEDPLAFRPNINAMVLSNGDSHASSSRKQRSTNDNVDDDDKEDKIYRPPRVAAMPYNEPGKAARKDRRAPALLSEFADTMDGAPILESTSGLATRPVRLDRHTNSLSAKRAKELKEIKEYEEANMTRLSTTKREAKRRREDEEALALGHGISEKARGRRGKVNGLEAELEGVLGSRGSRGVWDGVKDFGKRGDAVERGRKAGGIVDIGPSSSRKKKKARFEKDLAGHKKRSK